ncbi:MAG: sugar ABC transporter ATP-binding protein [Devosia sp.]
MLDEDAVRDPDTPAARQIGTPLWQVDQVTKSYPGVRANDKVSLTLRRGAIHGLLGENGCGKSTLIKMLSGVQEPDSGRILKNGSPVRITSPIEARKLGVATVFQEFSIVPTLSVAENVYLGRMPRGRFGQIDWQKAVDGTEAVLAEMGIAIPAKAITGTLSVAEQQLVEIAKALAANAEMIILDEPTAALGLEEIETLHGLLRTMKARGCAILYVSHRLDEVERIVDEVTILRNGKVVSESGATEITVTSIVEAMIGDTVGEHYPKVCNATDDVALEVEDIATNNGVDGVSFTLKKGEVLGLGGVLGSGRTEIARALFGIDPLVRGRVLLNGKPSAPRNEGEAIAAGFGLVSENRKFDGLFFNFSASGNLTSANLKALSPRFILNLGQETKVTRDYIDRLEISREADAKSVQFLSGGNQQKVVIARWLFADTDILIFDEPTQGIDIGAKVAVYRLMNQLTERGKSILLISSDHDELLAMSDRIAVVRDGRVVDVADAGALSHEDLVKASAEADATHKSTGAKPAAI